MDGIHHVLEQIVVGEENIEEEDLVFDQSDFSRDVPFSKDTNTDKKEDN